MSGQQIKIDGSQGEGGGQVLRSSLALSMCLGKPFEITNIRAARKRPGLQPQHLAAVKAAAAVCAAEVQGAERDSRQLVFMPHRIKAGDYHFDIGTAGSTTLVLQTILPALMLADGPSTLLLEGGTHNPFAPPFEFLTCTFLPLLKQMGPNITATLLRHGFAPKGGGKVRVEIQPVAQLQPLELPKRGEIQTQGAEIILAHLPLHIARREAAVIEDTLGIPDNEITIRSDIEAYGPGNVVSVFIKSPQLTECFCAFGQRGLPAEEVAGQVVKEVQRYLNAGIPVGNHLADQLLLPMALAGHGLFVTLRPSSHTLTNISVIERFTGLQIDTRELGRDKWRTCLP